MSNKPLFKSSSYILIGVMSVVSFSCSSPAPKEETVAEEIAVEETVPEKPAIVYDTNNPISLAQSISEAMGGMDALKNLNDVQYDYTYHDTPTDKMDISQEKYIFSNEHSWASYSKHEVNVSPGVEGTVVQAYDGNKAAVSINGEASEDEGAVGMAHFLRKANYFWFTMMNKLADPGTVHEYMGQEEVAGTNYDKLLVTYDSAKTGKAVNDTYILYIDPNTHMVNRFLFSLPALGVNDPVLLMEVDYQEMHGIQVPVGRRGYQTDGQGNVTGDAFVVQKLENIKFNNGLTATDLSI